MTIAEFDDGSNNIDGAEIKVFKNGLEVSLDEPFEEDSFTGGFKTERRLCVEGWEGDLPEDANRSFLRTEPILTMDRIVPSSIFPTPDDPRDFLDDYDIKVAATGQ